MFIEDQEHFDRWVLTFSPELYVGIDTEFVREKSFFPKLCLFQISSINQSVVIDVLKVNIDALLEKLQEKNIIKIFFSGRQDLEAVFKAYGRLLFPVFDLQIACDFLTYRENISFAEIVAEICHVTIDKQFQDRNWEERPLKEEVIEYANNDSKYLIPVYQTLKRKLKARGLYQVILEESALLFNLVMDQGDLYFEKKFYDPLSSKNALKYELTLWREKIAREKDIHRKAFYTDTLIHNMKDIPWACEYAADFQHQTSCYKTKELFKKLSLKIEKIAKQNKIPKKYFNYPYEVMKWITQPLQSNIFLEGWRYELLKDIRLIPHKQIVTPFKH